MRWPRSCWKVIKASASLLSFLRQRLERWKKKMAIELGDGDSGRGWRQVRRFGVFELLVDMLMCIQVENTRGQG